MPAALAVDAPRAARVIEEFAFEIRDHPVVHQGGNILTLKVRYRYRDGLKLEEYPDFTKVAAQTEEFFARYPNQTDFWELVNLKLTTLLLENYAAFSSVTVEILVSPSSRIPYSRSSTVTRSR